MSLKEVYYHQYCEHCEFRDNEEDAYPCHDCLNEPMNDDSHKPVYFKEEEHD